MAKKKSAKKTDGSGTIYRRKDKTGAETGPYWVKIHIDGRPVYESTGSDSHADAIKHRDKMLARKVRGELTGGAPEKITIGELIDDFLKYSSAGEETKRVYQYVLDANIRPYFGKWKCKRLTTEALWKYREQRVKRDKVEQSTVNRETAVLRIAFNFGRKKTPPTVHHLPHFPMVKETNIRQGFLSDEDYVKLRDALPPELKPLFVVAYATGARVGELLQVRWEQVDFDAEEIVLRRGETKNQDARVLPFLGPDMATHLRTAKQECDANWASSPWVFNWAGEPIKSFKASWKVACTAAGVPDLHFHDLRRTAVRNLRRVGVPQVVRMKISGHKTDSMERRYSIVDAEDFAQAKAAMAQPKS